MRTSPKSYAQASGEVRVTRKFLENFSGDQVGSSRLAGHWQGAGEHACRNVQGEPCLRARGCLPSNR